MTSSALDAGIGDLYIDSGPGPGAPGGVESALAGDPAAQPLAIAGAHQEIVFIEDDVPDLGTLINGIGRDKQVVILDSRQDGLHQIAQALAGRSSVDAVHIISHGQAGAADLGSLILSSANLGAHQDDLQTIRSSMSPGGDILLYGCDIGAGSGAGFVQQLAIATGADVAASNDLTGAAALGGDWTLEVSSGDIGTAPVVDAHTAALYQSVLNIPSVVVSFDNWNNFINTGDPHNANVDATYKVNGDIGYQLVIDGQDAGTASFSNSPYVSAASYGPDRSVTIKFGTGQTFTANSISLANFSSVYTTQNLVIRGYDAAGNPVGAAATPSLTYTSNSSSTTPVSLSGMTNITSLKITATSNGNLVQYLIIDNLSLANVQPPPPKVASVSSSTPNGAYKAGDVIHLTVGFDQAVTVDTAGGTPTLQLETGATDHYAVYAGGSGSSTLTFDYTVQAGDTSADLDYLSSAALAPNGATIRSSGGADAATALPAPGAIGSLGVNAAIVIDTTAPAAPSAPDLSAATDAGVSNSDNVTSNTMPTLTGTVSDADVTTVKLYDSDGVTQVGSGAVSGGAYSIALSTPLAEGYHTITARAIDGAGNVSTASSGLGVTIDITPPTVSVASDHASLTIGQSATVTFTFSEDPGATFTSGDISVSGGTVGPVGGTGTVRTVTFTPSANVDNGSASIGVNDRSYTDVAGNNGSAGAPVAISYDTKAPTLTIASDHASLAAGQSAVITFSFSEDPGASFTAADVTLSGGTLGAIAGSGTTRTAVFTPDANVNGGTASIAVAHGSYADQAGNLSTADASLSIAYDTQAPAAPSAPSLDTASDSGVSHADNLTSNTSLAFSGSAEANTSVKLYDTDGTTQIGGGSADASGIWHVTTGTLSAGAHTVTAVSIDGAGNASPASAGATVTIDTTPPTVTISSDHATLAMGETAVITFTFSEDPGASFNWDGSAGSIAVSGGALSAIEGSGTTRSAIFTPDANVDGGTASITVAAGAYTDAAGNAGAPGSSPSLSYDTLAPGAPSTPALDTGSDSGASHTDAVTNATTLNFSGTAQAGATVRLYDGAAEIGHVTADAGGNYAIAVTGLAEGEHAMTTVAADPAGNVSPASGTLTVEVDRTPPATAVTSVALSADTGASGSDMITSAASQTISGTLGANLAAGEQVMVSLDNGATWTAATASAGATTWSLAATLAGSDTLRVQVVDQAGNAGAPFAHAYTVDTVAPPAPGAPDLAAASDSGSSNTDNITAVTMPTFSGTAQAGSTVHLYDGATEIGSGGADASGDWTIAITDAAKALGAGSHTITATAVDAAGNVSSASSGLTIQVVTGAPGTGVAAMALSADSGASSSDFITNVQAQTLTGTLSSPLASGERVQVSLDEGGSWSDAAATAGSSAWSFNASLASGSHDIQVRVIDAVDNPGPVYTRAYTLDTAGPAVSIASSASELKIGETATITFTFSEDPGASFSWDGGTGDVVVSGGTLSAIEGSGLTRSAIFTPDAGVDGGTAGITVAAGAYADAAGNVGAAGATPALQFDTLAPPAPSAPALDAASDSGTVGDGVTSHANPVIVGTALANAQVVLYDTVGGHTVQVGTATADALGHWSIASAGLASGNHALSATQLDAAGNASAASAAFALQIQAPPPPPSTLIDGVAVDVRPVSLPGGLAGSAVSIPIVSSGRVDTSGKAGVADIPLATDHQGASLLLAQLAAGYGMSASGANVAGTDAGALLVAAIEAAAPADAANDQAHLVANGQSFLDGLGTGASLLVETVKPVGAAAAPDGTLTLSAPAAVPGQGTALVIDAAGLAPGNAIHLQQVNFAAVVGSADVVAQGGNTVLSGDAASQHLTVAGGGSGAVFAGGGADVLGFDTSSMGAAPAASVTLLHGGADKDVAVFSGAQSDYTLDFHNGYVVVASKAAPSVQALVVNVEQLQFSDASVTVRNSVDLSVLAGMYQTVLGRQADLKGIAYWADAHQAGASWGQIALDMIGSTEHAAARQGFDGDAAHDLTLLYNALFDRDPDAAGLAYWSAALSHGQSLAQVADAMVQSAEMVGHQVDAPGWNFGV